MAAAPATSCELSRRSRPGSARCNRAPSAKSSCATVVVARSSCATVVVAARVIEQFELAAGPGRSTASSHKAERSTAPRSAARTDRSDTRDADPVKLCEDLESATKEAPAGTLKRSAHWTSRLHRRERPLSSCSRSWYHPSGSRNASCVGVSRRRSISRRSWASSQMSPMTP